MFNKQVLGQRRGGAGNWGFNGLFRYVCRTFRLAFMEWGNGEWVSPGNTGGWGGHKGEDGVIFKGQQGGSLSFEGRFRENLKCIAPVGMGE